jgi:hypothetical protein
MIAGKLQMPMTAFGASPQTSLCATTLSSSSPPERIPASSAPPSVARSLPSASTRSSGALPTAMAVGIGAVLVLAAVARHRFHSIDKGMATAAELGEAPVAGPSTAASTPPVTATHDAAATSHVVVTASPKSAQLYVDDVLVSNPYITDQVRDSAAHRVRVEAPGYEAKARTFTFAEDIDIQIDLARKPAAPTASHEAAQPPARGSDCDPPFVLDSATGKKRWRLECL